MIETGDYAQPPFDYWPQDFDAVWDYGGVTCDNMIPVVPESRLNRLIEAVRAHQYIHADTSTIAASASRFDEDLYAVLAEVAGK